MPTTAEVRTWAVANGHPELEGGRGKIGQDIWDEFTAAHDYVGADEPPLDGQSEPDEPAAFEEDRPGRPAAARGRWSWRKPRAARAPRQGKPARARKAFRRISVAPLIEDAYADLAWASAGIPPLQRLFYAQAPVAGVILDPVVKDTIADRVFLQPAARNYEKLRAGMAMLGTPAALMGVLMTAPQPVIGEDGQPVLLPVIDEEGRPVTDEDGRQVVSVQFGPPGIEHKTAMVSLRYCVRAMVDLAGDAVTRVQQRAEEAAERDDRVNDFIAFLLGTGAPPDMAEGKAREGRDAGLRLAGATMGA